MMTGRHKKSKAKKCLFVILQAAILSAGLLNSNDIFAANQNEKSGSVHVGEEAADQDITANPMYRLYNSNSGEHFYTASLKEKNYLVSIGWNYEGVGWYAPDKDHGEPVYRLYNKNGGEHHYTVFLFERLALVKAGWKYEGVGWYSHESGPLNSSSDEREPFSNSVPLYRQYNPHAFANNHNYTGNIFENNYLVGLGWKAEGIGWYGIEKVSNRAKIIQSYDDFANLEGGYNYLQYFGEPDEKGEEGEIEIGEEIYTGAEYRYHNVELVDTGISGTVTLDVVTNYGGHNVIWNYASGTEEIYHSILKNMQKHDGSIIFKHSNNGGEEVEISMKKDYLKLTYDSGTREIKVFLAAE